MTAATAEARRDAKLFARWIHAGKMTLAEARRDLLVTPAQMRMIRRDHREAVATELLTQRMQTWRELCRLVQEPIGSATGPQYRKGENDNERPQSKLEKPCESAPALAQG
jgi:hypothetical protein